MKRNNIVINAQKARAGRRSLRWVANGCNWAPGASREELQALARVLLARGPAFAQRFAELVASVCDDRGTYGQTFVSALVRACAGDKTIAPYWRELAQERDNDRPMWAGWTYDTESESYILLAKACAKGATS